MQLTDDQKKAVCLWADEGCGLSEIQKNLLDQFGVSMTYMDVRFLVIDLGCTIRDKVEKKNPAPQPETDELEDNISADFPEMKGDVQSDDLGGLQGGNVKVTLDKLIRPGSIVSGSAVFSDGVTADWSLDQLGRLVLNASKQDYRPSESDISAFQVELRNLLAQRGY